MLMGALTLSGAIILAIGPAFAQQHTSRDPYALETFGAFRDLILNGDFTPKVTLREVMAKRPTTGVGAIADARGEITIYDGQLIASYGKEGPRVPAQAEAAGLLAIGTAPAWRSVVVDQEVAPAAIEGFIAQTAAAHGLKPDLSFPFQIRGTLTSYVMHVNAGPTDGPHGMGKPIAITAERKGDAVPGGVAGFYVTPDLVGIVTHRGTRIHSHWVAADGSATAHLDEWGLKAGAVLLIPAP